MASGSGTGTPISTTSGGATGIPVTGSLPADERRSHLSAVWVYDDSAGAYVNNTLEAQSAAGTAFTALETTSDYFYLGSESRFDLVALLMDVKASVSGLTWEYPRGVTWTQFIPDYEWDLAFDGAEGFSSLPNWAPMRITTSNPHSVSSVPDNTTRYYIRLSATSITTSPTINQIISRPYAAYCTPSDVRTVLQLDKVFTDSTRPTREQVEDRIHVAQSYVERESRRSWRLNFVDAEEQQFNIHGIRLDHYPVRFLGRVQIWDGSQYDTKTSGRASDYFAVNELGIMKFSRYFILPARFQSGRSLGGHGFGEFEYSIRISYLWGQDITKDNSGPLISDLTAKLAAIDLVTTTDESVLISMGVDHVQMAEKARSWREEVDAKLQEMHGWEVI